MKFARGSISLVLSLFLANGCTLLYGDGSGDLGEDLADRDESSSEDDIQPAVAYPPNQEGAIPDSSDDPCDGFDLPDLSCDNPIYFSDFRDSLSVESWINHETTWLESERAMQVWFNTDPDPLHLPLTGFVMQAGEAYALSMQLRCYDEDPLQLCLFASTSSIAMTKSCAPIDPAACDGGPITVVAEHTVGEEGAFPRFELEPAPPSASDAGLAVDAVCFRRLPGSSVSDG